MKEDKVDDFIGREFPPPKGGDLIVVGVNGLKGNKRMYLCNCSICSVDTELFPLPFSMTKSVLTMKRDSTPCAYNWSDTQYKIRVERECALKGYTFKGWKGKFIGKDTKIRLFNPITKNSWTTNSIHNLLNGGRGDPSQNISILVSP